MNFKTTLVLIVLLVLVGGYIAFDRARSSDGGGVPAPAPVAQRLVGVAYNDVNSLSIKSPAGEVALEKSGEEWRVTAPYQAVADRSGVGQYLAALTAAESKGEPGEGARKAFSPEVTVEMGAARKVEVSGRNAVGDTVVRVTEGNGTKWYLADGGLAGSLTKAPASFRDPRLVTASFGEIRSLSLEQGASKVEVIKVGDGWTVDEGKGAVKGDESAIGDLIQVLTGLRAAEFPAAPAAPFATTQLTLRFSAGSPTTGSAATAPTATPKETIVRFGRFEDARKQRVVVGVGDVVAYVPAYALNSLQKTGLDLRDKQIFTSLKPADISAIEIENHSEATTRPETVVKLVQAEGLIVPPATMPAGPRWMVGGVEADAQKMGALLDAIGSLAAVKFLSGAAATQPTFSHTIRIHTKDGVKELQVGINAGKSGDLVFEPSVTLLPLVTSPFVRPAPAPETTTAPTTSPATQP